MSSIHTHIYVRYWQYVNNKNRSEVRVLSRVYEPDWLFIIIFFMNHTH